MRKFTEWLNDELQKRDWSYNELARRAGLSSGGISLVMNEARKPGPELALRDVMPREIERLEQKGANLKAARAETEKALDRLAGAIASGTIRASTATRQEERLYEKLDSLDAEMQRVEEQRAALPSPEEQREYLDEVLDFDSANLNDATRHRLNRALRNLGVRFLCEDREVVAVVY